jgi:hypothetical protein
MAPLVYAVPVVDVTWTSFGPINPKRNYSAGPIPMQLCEEEAVGTLEMMRRTVDGRFVISPQTSFWAPDTFYRDPFMAVWKEAVQGGAELCIHTHAELGHQRGTLNGDPEHMSTVIKARLADCLEAGVRPPSYRGGLYAYANFLTPLLEELHLWIDYSAAPGFNQPDREAAWIGAPTSGSYLCPVDRTHGPDCGHAKSRIFEIPLGSDGVGTDNTRLLYVDFESTTLENLTRTWDVIAERSRQTGQPQFIHFLIHTITASNRKMQERYKRFLDHARTHGGETVTGQEAKGIYEKLNLR